MPTRMLRTRASRTPSGAPTIRARKKPVRNSSAESKNCGMNSPLAMSCQSRAIVSENGTMKAALVERPAISQSARPAAILSQKGRLRRSVAFTERYLISSSPPAAGVNAPKAGVIPGPAAGRDPGSRTIFGACVWIPGSHALACAPERQSLLHHRVRVFPDARIDELVVSDGFFVGLDRADLLHQGRDRIDLVLRQAIVLHRPEIDLEEFLQRELVHVLVVAGHRRDVRDRCRIFRIVHEVRGLDHAGDGADIGVAIGS